jgi:prephenate dehydrogenase
MTVPEKPHKRITIVGLGRAGQSIGLALRQAAPSLDVVGHDKEPDASRAAQKAGAVHKTHWNLISACDGAALVILALPASQVIPTMTALAHELTVGTVLTDTAAIKSPFARWAEANLPPSLHYIGGHPLAPMPLEPSANAFSDTTYCLTPAASAEPEAVAAVIQMVDLLRARPVFLEAEEHDSLMMGLQLVPALGAAAALETLMASEALADLHGLREALPPEALALAGFAAASLDGSLDQEERSALANWLRRHIGVLTTLAATLEQGDQKAVGELITRLQSSQERWLSAGQPSGGPQDGRAQGEYWRRMFGMR